MRIYFTLQHKIALILGRFGFDISDIELTAKNRIFNIALGIHISRIRTTLGAEFLYIYLRDNHLRFNRETFTL